MTTASVAPAAWQRGLGSLGRLILSLSTTATTAGNAVMSAESIAEAVDPMLIPEIEAAQIVLPLIGAALEILATGAAVPAPRWLGAPRAL